MTYYGGTAMPTTVNQTFTAADPPNTTGAFTATGTSVAGYAGSTTNTVLVIQAPAQMVTGNCYLIRYIVQDASGNATHVTAATAITASVTAGTIYSDSACTTPGFPSATLAAGASEYNFYYKLTTAGSAIFSGSAILGGSSRTATTVTVTTTTGTTGANRYVVYAPASIDRSVTGTQCYPILVQTTNGTNAAAVTANRTFMITAPFGNFYPTSSCTASAATNLFTIPSGKAEATVYYSPTAIALANTTTGLGGTSAGASPGSAASVGIGATQLTYPMGIAVQYSGATVQGIFVSNYNNHRVYYLNNTASTVTIGGTSIPSYNAGDIIGTGSASYNGDALGNLTNLYNQYEITLSNPGSALGTNGLSLYIADYGNLRVRSLDLSSIAGQSTTHIGAGRRRSGNLGDSAIDAPLMYLNSPQQIALDTPNRMMYISDSGNNRIRELDMLTGFIQTGVGFGSGAATVENQTHQSVLMTSPQGLAVYNQNGTTFLYYADVGTLGNANQNCLIRAYNTTNPYSNPPPSPVATFGTSVNPGTVSTIAGNYVSGCKTWNANGNTSTGTNAKTNTLYGIEGITFDHNGNLLVALWSDHCIVRITQSGTMSPVIGTCTTAGAPTNSTQTTLATYPSAIVMDPNNPGNFFYADGPTNAPSRINYVNYKTSSVTIGGTTIPAATAPYGYVVNFLGLYSPGTSYAYINSLALYGTQLCAAGGNPGNGSAGSHNVVCYNIGSSLTPLTLRVGSNETSSIPTRSGSPLDYTQEGAASTSALLFSPYGLAFDADGNLYISEKGNHLVRMVRRWF
jgi:hypothetical protein